MNTLIRGISSVSFAGLWPRAKAESQGFFGCAKTAIRFLPALNAASGSNPCPLCGQESYPHPSLAETKNPHEAGFLFLAEREGFEPSIGL